MKELKKFKLLQPFQNRKANSLGRVFGTIMTGFLVIMFLAWFVMKGSDIFVKSRANSICNRFTDAIAETGKITSAMQTELYKDFNKLKFFTGDYKVKFVTYDYSNPNAKVTLGTSNNGSSIPEATVSRGKIVQVSFHAEETALDKISNLFSGNNINGGLSASDARKVD